MNRAATQPEVACQKGGEKTMFWGSDESPVNTNLIGNSRTMLPLLLALYSFQCWSYLQSAK
jgi:hypothetical protein